MVKKVYRRKRRAQIRRRQTNTRANHMILNNKTGNWGSNSLYKAMVHKWYQHQNPNVHGTTCVYTNGGAVSGVITIVGTHAATTRLSTINNPTTDSMFTFQFALDQTQMFADGVFNQFDAYRIDKVVVKLYQIAQQTFIGDNNAANTVAAASNRYFVLKDCDDSTVPTDITSLRDDVKTKEFNYGNNHGPRAFTIYPRCGGAAFSASGLATSSTLLRPQWISIGSPTVPHYGLKIGIPQQGANQGVAFDVEVEYYISTRFQ